MHLLIVDDGQYVVEYLKHLLNWAKFGVDHIETTTNPSEARMLLDSDLFDIMITDIRMPEISGIDLLEHIHKQGLKTKVIFLSGYSQFDYAQKAIRLGALDYLLKPVDSNDMDKAMSQAVKNIGTSRAKPRDDATGNERNIMTRPADRSDGQASCSGADIVHAVRNYIGGHIGDGLSLEELGSVVHLHPVYLSKLYKQETGENLSSYILRTRLEKSAHLLEVSNLHVMDIARMVGYRKPQYFIKLFKELYGITPYQYRRKRIGQSVRTDF
ncbi:response regulator transcription factor [Paenibacillus lautus]|jgi:two-component system, response regulator YesN|uniref:response regulator transcription factor n=1 Tax=Paenibacillus lautus TaxID=1401 RepID=UPI0013E3D590|nr:response regulator [Paenibacillus lautus]